MRDMPEKIWARPVDWSMDYDNEWSAAPFPDSPQGVRYIREDVVQRMIRINTLACGAEERRQEMENHMREMFKPILEELL